MYRKFSADHLFTGQQLLPGNFVLITDNEGAVIDITEAANAGDGIENFNGILCPGFINAHCHLELSHMKGYIPEKTGLVDFVLKVIFERHFEENIITTAIEAAENEMLQNGIVAVGDICNNTLAIPQKSKRRLHYQNFIETSGFPPPVAENRFQKSVEFYKEYKKFSNHNSIVPHAPYSVSPELFQLINNFPDNNILTIHNQESAAENELFQSGKGDFKKLYEKLNIDTSFFTPSGNTSLQTYLPILQQYQSLILVHNVYSNKDDIHFEKQTADDRRQTTGHRPQDNFQPSTHYCLCPNANLYISNKLPDVNLLIEQQCNIVLGTDSLASNHQLSILEEMKTLHKHFPGINMGTLLQWATINGAKALQIEEQFGSFEKAKTPGIVLIEGVQNSTLTKFSSSKRVL